MKTTTRAEATNSIKVMNMGQYWAEWTDTQTNLFEGTTTTQQTIQQQQIVHRDR